MTNFELITQNPTTLDDFISAVVDDALAAKGCSIELKLPYALQDGEGEIYMEWKEWLEQEAADDCVYLPHNKTIERWRKWGEDNG